MSQTPRPYSRTSVSCLGLLGVVALTPGRSLAAVTTTPPSNTPEANTATSASAESLSPSKAADTPATPSARAEEDHLHGGVFLDPLGLLLFGPRLGVEFGGEQFAVAASARWFSGGALSKSLFPGQNESFAFSYGLGLRVRHYAQRGLQGLHLGVGAEYLSSRIENPSVAKIATLSSYLVPQVELGYRYQVGHFYLNPAAGLGYAAELSAEVIDINGGTNSGQFTSSDKSTVYGSVALELGATF